MSITRQLRDVAVSAMAVWQTPNQTKKTSCGHQEGMNPYCQTLKPFWSPQASRGSGYHYHEYSWLLPHGSNGKFFTYKLRPVNNNKEKGVSNSSTLPRTTCNLMHWHTWKLFLILRGDSWKSLKVIFLCCNLHAPKRNEDIMQHCRINSYCGNYWFDVKAN